MEAASSGVPRQQVFAGRRCSPRANREGAARSTADRGGAVSGLAAQLPCLVISALEAT
jgi:hypothetical protein